jgi:hypothetical protein
LATKQKTNNVTNKRRCLKANFPALSAEWAFSDMAISSMRLQRAPLCRLWLLFLGSGVYLKELVTASSAAAATTRHKSLQMIKRYGEAAEQRLRAPHRLRGVGL